MTNIDGYKITTRPTRPGENQITLPFAYNVVVLVEHKEKSLYYFVCTGWGSYARAEASARRAGERRARSHAHLVAEEQKRTKVEMYIPSL